MRLRVAVAAGLLLAVIMPFLIPSYFVDIMSRVLVFAIMAMGLNLLAGYSGLPSLGQSAFMAMGAYTAGLLIRRLDVGWAPALVAGIVMAAGLGALFGLIALRARGATFLLITLALAQSAWAVAFTWRSLTRGDDGLGSIPRPYIGSLELAGSHAYYFFVLVFFLILLAVFAVLVRSPFGLALQGIRDNELRMRSLGYHTWLYQYTAFILAAGFAGIAGVLRAYLVGAVVPGWSQVDASAEALLMVIMGGPGTVIGPLVGAAIIEPVSELANLFTQRWPLVLGVLYVVVILFAREGIVGWVRERFPARMTAGTESLALPAAAAVGESGPA
ncbi:MAG: branched-chain amino acid ABC transporter permease [Chloroflexota bacterium]